MTNKAIIFVDRLTEDAKQLPLSLLKVGGISILERQLRQLKKCGISQAYLVSNRLEDALQSEVKKFKAGPESIDLITDLREGDQHWGAHESLLIIEEGRLVDQRVIQAVIEAEGPNVLSLFSSDALLVGISVSKKINVKNEEFIFASVGRVQGDILTSISLQKDFNAYPIEALLKGFEEGVEFEKMLVNTIPLYQINLRRDLDILWRPIEKVNDCLKATKFLISRAQKGTIDAVARWVYPIPENFIVEGLLKTPFQGLMFKGLIVLLGFYLTWLFAIGHMGWGLAGAIIIGLLYGVEGKLSFVSIGHDTFTGWSQIEQKTLEYSWIFAMAYFMAEMTGNPALWAVALLVSLFDTGTYLQKSFYKKLSGISLYDAGSFERKLRLLGAIRNTRIWLLIPFAVIEKWELGFWAIALYTAITFFMTQYRFFKRTGELIKI